MADEQVLSRRVGEKAEILFVNSLRKKRISTYFLNDVFFLCMMFNH